MEFKILQLTFDDFGDTGGLQLKSEDLEISIDLENQETCDLKKFFDAIFKHIIEDEVMIQFELKNETIKALYQQVAEDLINQINGEIIASEANFNEIIALKNEVTTN